MDKKCSKCKKPKLITEFRLDKSRKDGHYPQCRKCESETNRERYKNNPEKQKSAIKKWYQANVTKVKNYHDKWRKSNPDKIADYGKTARAIAPNKWKARNAVNELIRLGKLSPATAFKCSNCKERQATHYHHHKGYAKEHWLDVVPVCAPCHKAIDSRH